MENFIATNFNLTDLFCWTNLLKFTMLLTTPIILYKSSKKNDQNVFGLFILLIFDAITQIDVIFALFIIGWIIHFFVDEMTLENSAFWIFYISFYSKVLDCFFSSFTQPSNNSSNWDNESESCFKTDEELLNENIGKRESGELKTYICKGDAEWEVSFKDQYDSFCPDKVRDYYTNEDGKLDSTSIQNDLDSI